MATDLLQLVESHEYQKLFLSKLRWSKPDIGAVSAVAEDGSTLTAKNVSSYKGLRVWVCAELPDADGQVRLDRAIAAKSTDRLVIFHDTTRQVWRWPVRTVKGSSVSQRLSSHLHVKGQANPKLVQRLETIILPVTEELGVAEVLEKLRIAFDIETDKETKRASKLMAAMFDALTKAEVTEHETSVTLARALFLLFGDDTDMWPKDLFRDFVLNHTRADGSDLADRLNELFAYLNTSDVQRNAAPDRFTGFKYVNGGVFAEDIKLPKAIGKPFRDAVLEASKPDWSDVSPAIFGSMFQSVRDAKTRRDFGEHYTSERDILRTLDPLFLDELRARFTALVGHREESAGLVKLRNDIASIKFLDPACGCGNFIVIAYRELRHLEIDILERLKLREAQRGNIAGGQTEMGLGLEEAVEGIGQTSFLTPKVSLSNFFGIEIDEWPAKIAETAMFLIERQCDMRMLDRLGYAPTRLPIARQATIATSTLGNPDGGNALRLDWPSLFTPDDRTIVAGNPPYLGQGKLSAGQVLDAKSAWGGYYDGYLDFVTSWHAKSIRFLQDSAGARFAFVTTNSIVQGQPVEALFRPLFDEGWRIRFAHNTFPWESEASGKAAVHCVIVGFDRERKNTSAVLWDYSEDYRNPVQRDVPALNAYLTPSRNVYVRKSSAPISRALPPVRYGSKPTDGGHLILDEVDALALGSDPAIRSYVRPFKGADELLSGRRRWCLWLQAAPPGQLSEFPAIQRRLDAVREMREKSSDPATRQAAERPHLFQYNRQPDVPYLCIPRVVSGGRKYFTTARFDSDVIANDAVFTAPDDDGFLFGLISSLMFITWQKTIGGRLKSDYRFSNTIVWNNFPLRSATETQRAAVIEAGQKIVAARANYPSLSLADLYDPRMMPLDLQEAHDALDAIVDPLFGLTGEPSEQRRQQCLFDRYAELTGQ